MCLPGNSVLSSTKEDQQNKLLVTCYLLPGPHPGGEDLIICHHPFADWINLHGVTARFEQFGVSAGWRLFGDIDKCKICQISPNLPQILIKFLQAFFSFTQCSPCSTNILSKIRKCSKFPFAVRIVVSQFRTFVVSQFRSFALLLFRFLTVSQFRVFAVWKSVSLFNPFRPEFIIVIFIHYKPRIAAAILNL